jgi:hypothetical protein
MTEAEWLRSDDASELFRYVSSQTFELKERKYRLFACACFRLRWPTPPNELSRRALELADLHAEGRADRASLDLVDQEARE